jgi:hypothetical protein
MTKKYDNLQQEIISLPQHGAQKSVFARHYFKPNFTDEKKKVTVCLDDLYQEINTA